MTSRLLTNENLAYHVARLLILIGHCGKPQNKPDKVPAIQGRTLLAKLDFFMRYPAYLKRAAEILQISCTDSDLGLLKPEDLYTVESHMVRYLYGPWDSLYYVAIAYMVGKKLIEPPKADKVEHFQITVYGQQILSRLENDSAFLEMVQRADTIYHLFNAYNGSRLKTFIYEYFPDVVNRSIGKQI